MLNRGQPWRVLASTTKDAATMPQKTNIAYNSMHGRRIPTNKSSPCETGPHTHVVAVRQQGGEQPRGPAPVVAGDIRQDIPSFALADGAGPIWADAGLQSKYLPACFKRQAGLFGCPPWPVPTHALVTLVCRLTPGGPGRLGTPTL